MADFDQAERYAIKRLHPPGFLRWLLQGLDPDLAFARWLETQLAPFPGEPDRRCDCVAELVSLSGSQPPWAGLIEPQGQPQARFLVRVLQYLLGLHDELTHGPHGQDRYPMLAGIVNLCDQPLQTELAWVPPGATGRMGLTGRVWVRDVYTEDASVTMEGVATGSIHECVLVWVPCMRDGELPATVARWKELVDGLPGRDTYAALALVFAEKRGRLETWGKELEGWNVQKSVVIERWREEGRDEGRKEGRKEGQEAMREVLLGFLRGRANGPVPEDLAEAIARETNLRRLSVWTAGVGSSTSLEEARRVILEPLQ